MYRRLIKIFMMFLSLILLLIIFENKARAADYLTAENIKIEIYDANDIVVENEYKVVIQIDNNKTYEFKGKKDKRYRELGYYEIIFFNSIGDKTDSLKNGYYLKLTIDGIDNFGYLNLLDNSFTYIDSIKIENNNDEVLRPIFDKKNNKYYYKTSHSGLYYISYLDFFDKNNGYNSNEFVVLDGSRASMVFGPVTEAGYYTIRIQNEKGFDKTENSQLKKGDYYYWKYMESGIKDDNFKWSFFNNNIKLNGGFSLCVD